MALEIGQVSIRITQEVDCCGPSGEILNTMVIDFVDGGGGFYPVITTDRWALDDRDSELASFMSRVIKLIERHNEPPSE